MFSLPSPSSLLKLPNFLIMKQRSDHLIKILYDNKSNQLVKLRGDWMSAPLIMEITASPLGYGSGQYGTMEIMHF